LIGDTLDALEVSTSDAARGLGITRQQLHDLIAGRSGLTPETAVKLEKAIGSAALVPSSGIAKMASLFRQGGICRLRLAAASGISASMELWPRG
jgi:hypothetical protein